MQERCVAVATTREQFIVDEKGKKTGVVLPLRRYQRLLEDLHDLAVVAERRSEKPIAAEALKRRLKEDGKL
jgi:PHD/YefM family antitoxin component YafN of YafNO toxin-antitoxin module